MPFKEHTMWSYVCDWPGCTKDAQEDSGEYVAWTEKSAAWSDADENAGWHRQENEDPNTDTLYCHEHWHWCENDDEEPTPGPPTGCCAPAEGESAP